MEKTPGIRTAPQANEVRSHGRVAKLAMVIALALSGVLGGCSNPDNFDKCVGEDSAKALKSNLKRTRNTCKERVKEYTKTTDGDSRPALRGYAEHACTAYSKELTATQEIVAAKRRSHSAQENWSKRDSCAVTAAKLTDENKKFTDTEIADLLND
jgi:hypothetical protein